MTTTFSRRLRRATLSLMPAPQLARLRQWYQAAAAAGDRTSADFAVDGTTVSVHAAGRFCFRIPLYVRPEIEIHFRDPECAAEVAAFLRSVVSPGVLFDVGANNGLFSLLFCSLHGSNRAFGYEPSPLFADRAEEFARLNGFQDRLQIVRKAIADTADEHPLLIDDRTGRVQAMQFEGTVHDGWVNRPMASTTLDLEAARVGAPTVVKIDVEGYEWEVLQGAQRLLAEAAPVVLLELHLNFLEQRGIGAGRVCELLHRHGYNLHDLTGRPLSERRLAHSWANIVHVIASPAAGLSH